MAASSAFRFISSHLLGRGGNNAPPLVPLPPLKNRRLRRPSQLFSSRPRIRGGESSSSSRGRQTRRKGALFTTDFEDDDDDDDEKKKEKKKSGRVVNEYWTRTPFESYAEKILTRSYDDNDDKTVAAKLNFSRGGVDLSVFLLCAFIAADEEDDESTSNDDDDDDNNNNNNNSSTNSNAVSFPVERRKRRRRRLTHAQMRALTKISERWNWKILKRVESAEDSLFSLADFAEEENNACPPAREFGEELKRLREKMEKAKRAQMWKLVEDEAWCDDASGEGREEEEENSCSFSGNRSRETSSSFSHETDDDDAKIFDASTKIACENIRVYFEYLGFQPTSREWLSIQTLLGECLTSEKDRTMIRAPPSSSSNFHVLKRTIDHKTKKPWKDAERRNLNRRYLLARENLLEAKKEWALAEQSYKEARRKITRARHEVAKTRKHVRIEFR